MELQEYFNKQYGGQYDLTGARNRLKAVGQQVNIAFDFAKILTPTLRSHTLIQLASEKGKVDGVVEKIFSHYFEQGKALGDTKGLVACASEAGLGSPTEVEAYITDAKQQAKVNTEADRYRNEYGVSGVPFFIVQGTLGAQKSQKLAFSGAQPASTFVLAFKQALALKK